MEDLDVSAHCPDTSPLLAARSVGGVLGKTTTMDSVWEEAEKSAEATYMGVCMRWAQARSTYLAEPTREVPWRWTPLQRSCDRLVRRT